MCRELGRTSAMHPAKTRGIRSRLGKFTYLDVGLSTRRDRGISSRVCVRVGVARLSYACGLVCGETKKPFFGEMQLSQWGQAGLWH